MRLNHKYTIAYAIITLITLSIGFSIVYNAIKRNVIQTLVGKLENVNKMAANQISQGQNYEGYPCRKNIQIKTIPYQKEPSPDGYRLIKKEWDESLQDEMSMLYLSSTFNIKGQTYQITSKAILVEPEDIYLNGIILVFAWTFVFLLALVVVLSEVFSLYILRPFNDTLAAIQLFNINQKSTIDVHETKTYEFRALNDFLVKMTNKAKCDYTALKEFSVNAAHELQTPVATIKAKIELLMETPLQENQLNAISEMHNELERLSRINKALTLLARLEHHELADNDLINMSSALNETIASFSDLIEMKKISLHKNISDNESVYLERSLAQVLLSNLISNAIRHNLMGGELHITFKNQQLSIRNTGLAPFIPVEELFGRFKKGNSHIDSIGIGLAIVKKICILYRHSITYSYHCQTHEISILFSEKHSTQQIG